MHSHRSRRFRGALGSLVVVGVLLAACGDDSSDSGTSSATTAGAATSSGSSVAATTTAAQNIDANGILKVGFDLAAGSTPVTLDPIKSRSAGDYVYQSLIYDSLIRMKPDGGFAPGLAESFSVVDPKTLKVTLRSGLTFTDGTPLDAAAVKFTLERSLAAKNANFAPVLSNMASATADDARNLTIALNAPVAGAFLEVLAGREAMPVSPTAVQKDPANYDKNPVGAGPMKLSQFTPSQTLQLRKNDTYWDKASWKYAGIDFVAAAAGAPLINAMLADQIDVNGIGTALTVEQGSTLSSRPGFKLQTVASDSNFAYIAICKSKPPFDNLQFRQAVAYAIDRDAINNAIYGGKGEPQYMMWPKDSRFFTASLDNTYKRDLTKAKALLTQAGYPNGIDLDTITLESNRRLSELLQAQLAEAGIRVKLQPTADIVTDFYTNVKTPAAVSGWIRPGVQKITRAFGPNSVANVCQYSNPELNALTDQLATMTPDDPRAKGLWDQVNKFVVDNVLWELLAWQPLVYGVNTNRIGGDLKINVPLQAPDFSSIYVKKS
ncbi:MAG: ABC transporter substrate-binding protein [Acidimicrobiia bacterium]